MTKQVAMGMKVEREHDDITGGNPKLVRKIVNAHLKELPNYYTKLKKMEKKAALLNNIIFNQKSRNLDN